LVPIELVLTEGWGSCAPGFIVLLALIGCTLLGLLLLSIYDWLLGLLVWLKSFVLLHSISLALPSSFVCGGFVFLNVFLASSYLRVYDGGYVVVAFFDS